MHHLSYNDFDSNLVLDAIHPNQGDMKVYPDSNFDKIASLEIITHNALTQEQIDGVKALEFQEPTLVTTAGKHTYTFMPL